MSSVFTTVKEAGFNPLNAAWNLMLFSESLSLVRTAVEGLDDAVSTNRRREAALEVARDYGVDKPRMKMLSADRELGLAEQVSCPSVESFDLVAATPKDSRTAAVVACLESATMTEKELLSTWLNYTTPRVENSLSALESSFLPTLKSMLTSAMEAVLNSEGPSGNPQPESYETLKAGLESVSSLVADIAPFNADTLIVDEAHRTALKESFESIATQHGTTLKVHLSTEGYLTFNSPEVSTVGLGTVPETDAVYSKEEMISLIEQAGDVIDKLDTLASEKAELVAGLDTGLIAIESLDGMEQYTLLDHRNALSGYTTLLCASIAAAAGLLGDTCRAVNHYCKP